MDSCSIFSSFTVPIQAVDIDQVLQTWQFRIVTDIFETNKDNAHTTNNKTTFSIEQIFRVYSNQQHFTNYLEYLERIFIIQKVNNAEGLIRCYCPNSNKIIDLFNDQIVTVKYIILTQNIVIVLQ